MVDISLNDYYDKGLDIIQKAKEARQRRTTIIDLINNSEYKMSQKSSDGYWKDVVKKLRDELKGLDDELSVYDTELHYLKEFIDEDFYKLLLQNYGYMLADTSDIHHLKNCLNADEELTKAVSETKQMIMNKNYEMNQAIADENDDYKEILDAEINYYKKDMELHPWGVQGLELIDKELEEGKKL